MIEKYGKKKKLVAWYVARCGSKSERESYINELKVSFCFETLPMAFLSQYLNYRNT